MKTSLYSGQKIKVSLNFKEKNDIFISLLKMTNDDRSVWYLSDLSPGKIISLYISILMNINVSYYNSPNGQ